MMYRCESCNKEFYLLRPSRYCSFSCARKDYHKRWYYRYKQTRVPPEKRRRTYEYKYPLDDRTYQQRYYGVNLYCKKCAEYIAIDNIIDSVYLNKNCRLLHNTCGMQVRDRRVRRVRKGRDIEDSKRIVRY